MGGYILEEYVGWNKGANYNEIFLTNIIFYGWKSHSLVHSNWS